MKKLTFYLILALLFLNLTYLNAQWIRTEGIFGGTVNALAVNGNTILAGTEYEGVYKSTDNGLTWMQTTLNAGSISSILISGDYVFAGCGNHNLYDPNWTPDKGIYVSADFGETWTCTFLKSNDAVITSFTKFSNRIYASINLGDSTKNGIIYSDNSGVTWNYLTEFPNSHGRSLASNGTYLFASLEPEASGEADGIYRSDNNGLNWVKVINNSCYPGTLASSGSKVIFGRAQKIFISTNDGSNWNNYTIGFSVRSLAISGGLIFAGTTDGMLVSSDDGQTWTPTTMNSREVLTISFGGSSVFAGLKSKGLNTLDKEVRILSKGFNPSFHNGGVYSSSDNGTNWVTSFYNATVRCIAESGSNLIAGTWGSGGAYYSTDAGQNWLESDLNNRSVRCFLNDGASVFAGTPIGVYKSTNNGVNWKKSHTGNLPSVHSLLKSGTKFYAACVGNSSGGVGQLLMSADNCVTWNGILPVNYQIANVFSVVSKDNNLFAGGQIYKINTYNYTYLLKSTDEGSNWTEINSINKVIISLAVKGNYLFAGTANDGIYRSSDEGNTWIQVGLAGQFVESIIIDGDVIIAGGYGVYISYNNGSTWVQKNTGFSQTPTIGALCVANNYLYAGTYYSSAWRRPYQEIINNVPEMPVLQSPLSNSTGISITPTLRWYSVFGATQYSILVALDENFTNVVHTASTASTQYAIPSGTLVNNTKYYWKVKASNANGSSPYSVVWNFTTKPPTTVGPWSLYNTGVPYSLFGVDFSTFDTQTGVAVGEGGTVIKTTNGGEEWTLTYQNINIWMNDVKFDPNIPGNVWAAGMGGVILKSTNNGDTWITARGFDTPTNTIRGIGIPENYPNYITFVGYAGTFFVTTNNGSSFNKRTDIIFTMHSIAFSPNFSVNGKAIISGTDGLVWNTSNFGTNWVSRQTNRYDYMNDVVFTDASTAMICGNNGTILRTTNAGNTWTLNAQSLTTEHLRSIDVFMPKVTVCGDNGKIMTSNDGGITFLDQLAGEPRHLYGVSLRSVNEGTIVGEVGSSFAGAMYFSMMNGAVSVSNEETEIPTVFELRQNYPNPFNPTTKITYLLPKNTNVTLTVYDVLGREMKKLVNNQIMKAGKHTVEFGGQDYSSGVYFYRLQTNEFTDTKRMVMIK